MKNGKVYALGLNFRRLAEHEIGHSPAAALLEDGVPVAMVEEERFARVKDAPGYFPTKSTQYCLDYAGIEFDDVDIIGWNWDPHAHAHRSLKRRTGQVRAAVKAAKQLFSRPPLNSFSDHLPSALFPERVLEEHEAIIRASMRTEKTPPLLPVDHHYAHAASAFYPSGFDEATIVTWDAYGDELSAMVCHGRAGQIEVLEEYPFDQFSIGMLHHVMYKFLRLAEKGNLMGLAGYGELKGTMDPVADLDKLTMKMPWILRDGPFAPELLAMVGQPRAWEDELTDHHKTLAADLQDLIERFGRRILNDAVKRTGCRVACFAGGVALNATMNGKFYLEKDVDDMYVQPGAIDCGGALGAAYIAHRSLGHDIPPHEMDHAYWGPSYQNDEIRALLENIKVDYEEIPEDQVADRVSQLLFDQKIVGWFRGRAEFGPRALGARSILGDPRNLEMRDKINLAVKYRDKWRPFAASMLAEKADEYLTGHCKAPFMITTFPVREEAKEALAAVVHVDGTTRPQLVERHVNPAYYDLIKSFGDKSGVYAVLNTSFNLKGEPLVNAPIDGLRTFFSSGIDTLVLENFLVHKPR